MPEPLARLPLSRDRLAAGDPALDPSSEVRRWRRPLRTPDHRTERARWDRVAFEAALRDV